METGAPSAGPRAAVLLAAGEGSRLRPLTERIPKPLLPIDGEPVLGRLLDQLRAAGVTRLVVVVGYLGGLVEAFVRERAHGLDVRFVTQPERRGTGDALQLARTTGIDEGCIVAAADTAWRSEDVASLLAQAGRDRDALATMSLLRWPIEQLPHGFAVRCDDDDRVLQVLHRLPAGGVAGETARSGSPLYVFRREFWSYVDALQPGPTSGVVQLADALQQAIDEGRTVRAFEVHAARDLTRPDDLLRANFPYLGRWLDEANPPA